MRTTLNLDDDLLDRAQKFTGLKKKTELVHVALRALVERESARRVALLGGTMPEIEAVQRRNSSASAA